LGSKNPTNVWVPAAGTDADGTLNVIAGVAERVIVLDGVIATYTSAFSATPTVDGRRAALALRVPSEEMVAVPDGGVAVKLTLTAPDPDAVAGNVIVAL
jgi:hypothetical protein